MNQNSRTKNSTYNLIANFVYQFIILALTFLSRRVFIETLGVEFLGISGLFNNILSVLSIAELGIGSSMYYSMYKAISKNDEEKIKGLTTYYKSVYLKIALVIFTFGMLLVPFLRSIVKVDRTIPHLEIYYIVILLNSVMSYLFVYKTTVLYADQKGYKLKAFNIIMQIIKTVIELLVLLLLKKYLLYILVSPVFVLITNIVCVKVTEKLYPFIKEKGELKKYEKKIIWRNIKSMFFYKISGVILNNTDNILISIIINTNMVGYYSNYTMITNKLFSVINMFFSSLSSSVGSLNASSDRKKIFEIFKVISFMSFWLFAFACIGIFFVGEDVVKMMSGHESFVLSKSILIITIFTFYLKVSKNPITIYRETTGLFKLTKYSILCSAILNIVFSIIFGKIWGLFGILLATLISRLLCDVWYEPFILYKDIFKENVKSYLFEQIKYIVITLLLTIAMIPLFDLISISNLYIRIMVKAILVTVIVNIVFLVIFRKNNEYIFLKEKVFFILNKAFRRKTIKD